MPNRAARRIATAWPTAFPWTAPSVVTLFLIGLFHTTLLIESPRAELRTVTAQGEHRMGDRDTREDAIRLATEAAKRTALEQVATYLESVTVVTDLDVTKDEIRTYTAGVVLVLDQQVSTSLDGETVIIHVDLTAQVDTDEVVQAIAALRQNEDARQELVALKTEVDQLHQELDAANQALAAATTPEEVKELSEQRQELLNKAQSNGLVSQAWTNWVLITPVVSPYPWVGLAQVQSLLNAAGRLNPTNPHVHIVQQVITTQAGPLPPQPSAPSAPQTSPSAPTIPTHQIAPQQSAPPAVQQTTLPQPPSPQDPRRLTDIRQPNPFLTVPIPPASGATPPDVQQSHSPQDSQRSSSRKLSQRFQQMPPATQSPPPVIGTQPSGNDQAQPPRLSQSPVPRRLSPTVNQIHPPPQQQVPRSPFRVAPQAPRTNPSGGGGGHRGGGGRR